MKDYLGIGGKTAIVTGAGRGIGKACAKALADYGVKVAIFDINDENGNAVKDEIIAEGGEALYIHCNVTKIEEIKASIKHAAEAFGGSIDILVNNAGGSEKPIDFWNVTDELWNKIVTYNLYSQFWMAREVFPYMKEKGGKMLNISSGYAICGGDQCIHYASAKAGVIGLTSSLAKECAPFHINVNVIPVPTTDTPGLHESDGEFVDDELPLIPQGRIAVPEDIANTVLFLVSQAAEYVTGQIVAPNGGRRMLV